MKVLKFGGTSVKDPGVIKEVIEIVRGTAADGPVVVTVSAFGGVTDQLVGIAAHAAQGDDQWEVEIGKLEARCLATFSGLVNSQILENELPAFQKLMKDLRDVVEGCRLVMDVSPKSRDYILAFGERMSSFVISLAFQAAGLEATCYDSRELILTDSTFGKAQVDFERTNKLIRNKLGNLKNIAIVPGFIARDDGGRTTTLGRGGSDFTAAIYAAALKASMLEIWTDVSGMMTADPRIVKQALPIPEISYKEAMELSHFGAKVMYLPALQPVMAEGIPIAVKNTFSPEDPGTLIRSVADKDLAPITGISSMGSVALMSVSGSGMVGVPGSSSRLFGALHREEINVILITQASSEHSITFAILPGFVEAAIQAIETEFAYEISLGRIDPPRVETDLAIVAVVGENMRNQVGISGKMFSTLGQNGVNIRAIAQGSSELNISAVIASEDVKKALNVLHESFFLSQTRKANLFIVGVGTVGKALMAQIRRQQAVLKDALQIDLQVVGLANSRKMIFNEAGIDLENWEEQLAQSEISMDKKAFLDHMSAANLHNSIFIDNTAEASVANWYEEILKKSISVVTPNKIAASSAYEQYLNLKTTARKYGVKYLFETNVGAGLPVISTLNDLIQSGDRVHRIEAVLSGSLNFIFNNFVAGTQFHDIVKQAGLEGYTEPDPRIDLSGLDVMRKILILARESGLPMELEDITPEPFMPGPCNETESVSDFFEKLKAHAADFEKMRAATEAEGKKFKFVATLEGDKAKVGLQSVGEEHPFYHLYGKDNVVLFYTDRYQAQPLVVKGAGAGAEVTASGIFADVIRIVNV